MTDIGIKAQLLNKAIRHLEGLVLELRDEVKNKLRGEGSTDEGGFAGNFGDYSAQSAENFLKEQALIRRAEAQKHEQTIEQLRRLNVEAETETVQLMSLVETNHGTFLVSLGLRPVEQNGKKYMFLATDAPIYEAMAGKKKGDTFTFRGISYEVLSVQ